ncbi:hypothetical protein C3B58_21350, partial [Lactonifactor longoviformis]
IFIGEDLRKNSPAAKMLRGYYKGEDKYSYSFLLYSPRKAPRLCGIPPWITYSMNQNKKSIQLYKNFSSCLQIPGSKFRWSA